MRTRMPLFLVALLATAACGGGIEGPVALSTIESEIFARSCTSCHAGSAPSGGLDLEGRTYERLVDRPSNQDASVMRIVPGDPEASYLFQKITGTAEEGNRMPPLRALPGDHIDFIEAWILAGALDD